MIGNFSCSCLHLYISSVSVRAKGVNTLGISPSKCVETNVLLVLMNMLGWLHMKTTSLVHLLFLQCCNVFQNKKKMCTFNFFSDIELKLERSGRSLPF